MLVTSGPTAGAGVLLRGNGGSATTGGSSASVPVDASAVTAAQAAALAQRAQATLLRSNTVQQSLQAMQAAARAAAQAAVSNVPNGLGTGGLHVAPGVPANLSNVLPTENAALWQGAQLPTQTTTSGQTNVTIKQTAQQALLNWQTFNIGKETTLTYDQSAGGANTSQWIAFNKINDPTGNPSQILGAIKATGQVYVINQNGIIFGGSSQVNTHTLVASSLPINDNLIARGLLNNPDNQFLFSTLVVPAGAKGPTPIFTPPVAPLIPNGLNGDVVVEAGALLSSPTTADHVGGRIALIGPNVVNAGSISTPDGQAILAAGLQVGFAAHSSDASLRGLDVFVGSVGTYGGTVANSQIDLGTGQTQMGIIDAPRGDITLIGKTVNQSGAVTSSTSTSLNGRIDLLANYNAVGVNQLNFFAQNSGLVELTAGSLTQVLPEWSSSDRVAGASLALASQINIRGKVIHFGQNAALLAPSATVNLNAGDWSVLNPSQSNATQIFVYDNGQIYLDQGSFIDVSGSTDVAAAVTDNIISVQLRGAELANYPLQQNGALRGQTIQVDIRQTGTYNGKAWVGTPVADTSGYVALVDHTVGQLTTNGGTVNLNAGGSVVIQSGASINVSGGTTSYQGGTITTSKVLSNGHIYDISQATPDLVYSGLYTGSTGTYEAGYIQGGNGGSLTVTAPSMAIDGRIMGTTVVGSRQRSAPPVGSSLSLNFQGQYQDPVNLNSFLTDSRTPPAIKLQSGVVALAADAFALDPTTGNPLALRQDRQDSLALDPALFTIDGIANLAIINTEGSVIIPAGVTLSIAPKGSLAVQAANIDIAGNIQAPGGNVNFTATTISRAIQNALVNNPPSMAPTADTTRGNFTLGAGASIDTKGLLVNDQLTSNLAQPVVTVGGSIAINAFNVTLAPTSTLDVSGGVAMSSAGKLSYGAGGSISIIAGQDFNIKSVYGGGLSLGSSLLGFSGAKGAALTIQAPFIQIGGTGGPNGGLFLAPDFFNQGGFTSFNLTGLGATTSTANVFTPGVLIAPGVTLAPVVSQWIANVDSTMASGLSLSPILQIQALRSPVSLSLKASGERDIYRVQGSQLLVRGDLIVSDTSNIITDPKGSVTLAGDTVVMMGSVQVPAGSITIKGGNDSVTLFPFLPADRPYITVDLGANSALSAAGATLLTPDASGHNYRLGTVLDGGTISVSGNILAEKGAVIDVSGTAATLDTLNTLYSGVISQSVATGRYAATRIESNAGSIILTGGQALFTDATLKGFAGGNTMHGGTLTVSSGLYFPLGVDNTVTPLLPNIIVTQSGAAIPAGFNASGQNATGQAVLDVNGLPLAGRGYVAADSMLGVSGIDALTLSGTLQFTGPVSLTAFRSLVIANGGVIFADSNLSLAAPYIQLGMNLLGPQQTGESLSAFTAAGSPFRFAPVYGTGALHATGQLIDVGNLSLQGIGQAGLFAAKDIRGSGTLDIAGAITLTAGQIYPPTETTFTVAAYDYTVGGISHLGTINVMAGGTQPLPLSAGGALNVYASIINQSGTLRAPLGSINLGWNGAGTAPIDFITNQSVPVAQQTTLAIGSITSVSAIDPITGVGTVIPYGINLNGTAWIDPSGIDITLSGVPAKKINIGGQSIVTQAGSLVDFNGGGDLYAYRWVNGVGGTNDILASTTSFAILPNYQLGYAPLGAYDTSSTAVLNLGTDTGYINPGLAVGSQVHLSASQGLPEGNYTLLPARYALLPGAFLITPTTGIATSAAVVKPDGSSVVAGYRFLSTSSASGAPPVLTNFEVASQTVVRSRAEYDNSFANAFLSSSAQAQGIVVPRLPTDAGQLVLTATQMMNLQGGLTAQAVGTGQGGLVDISSPVDIIIGTPDTAVVNGSLVLDSSKLSAFEGASLFIGGVRQTGTTGTTLSISTNNITVDNAGSPLTGADIILAAKNTLTLAAGAEVDQKGVLGGATGTLLLGTSTVAGSGNGVLLRVSSDISSGISRSGVDSSTTPVLSVGAATKIGGVKVILDSTATNLLDPTAVFSGTALTLDSGRISIELNAPGTLQANPGLVLTGPSLQSIQSTASILSLLSYSSIDVYGTGKIGGSSFASLGLHAPSIRGFNNDGGSAIFVAQTITLDGGVGGIAPVAVVPTSGTLEFDAATFNVGTGALKIDQYSQLSINATSGILVQGSGSLTTTGAAELTTPLLTGSTGDSFQLTANGHLGLNQPTVATAASLASGLGVNLVLTGSDVTVDTSIQLPSGSLTLHASNGDLVLGQFASLSTRGTAQTFYNQIKYTDGGKINLSDDLGSIRMDPAAIIDVSAQPGAGNAGSVSLSAPNGIATLTTHLAGQGGAGGQNGIFNLDIGSLPSLALWDSQLNVASFTEARSYRVRTGDVVLDGAPQAHTYSLSVDQGNLNVTGIINATGTTGGVVSLLAESAITLASGSSISVAAINFDSAGKGGTINLETRGINEGVIDVQTGSILNLSVAANTPSSASMGDYTGTLHLRAPQTTAQTDLLVNPINGRVMGASAIIVEGFADFVPSGGLINTVQAAVDANAKLFAGNTGDIATAGTMINRLLATNASLVPVVSVEPGAEIINSTSLLTPVNVTLNTAGSSSLVVAAGVPLAFPNGTIGTNRIRSTAAGSYTDASGTVTKFLANTSVNIPAGAVVLLNLSGTVSFVSGGTGGAILVTLPILASFTSAGSTTVTPSGQGAAVTLNTSGSSRLGFVSGAILSLPSGTPGNDMITSTVSGVITSSTGVTSTLVANVPTAIAPSSTLEFTNAGTLSFASGGTGGAIPMTLPQSGTFTLQNAATILTPTNNLTLATTWDLSGYRYSPNNVPGVLTLRAAGNLIFNFKASLSDGFAPASASATDLWQAPLMTPGSRSWSYRLVAGADFSAANFAAVLPIASISAASGSLLLGNGATVLPVSSSSNTVSNASIIPNFYQVIRTGTGDININAGRDVLFLNPLATVYTAGTQSAAMNNFDMPVVNYGFNGVLGDAQTQFYPAQYSQSGGNISIVASNDIARMIGSSTGAANSTYEMPINWLYRRGGVDPATGQFAIITHPTADFSTSVDETASTTWWVDFSNFFQDVGALGGGNVIMTAGRDVSNVSASIPTNARMPKGTPDVATLVEQAGGDLSITAGRDINGGVYYVERGQGSLDATGSIHTNSTRAALTTTQANSFRNGAVSDSSSWLPTTLFLGKGDFQVEAGGDLLAGPVGNLFLLPQGLNNTYQDKTYFSTYAADSSVSFTSLTGSITLRNDTSGKTGSLYNWFNNVLLFDAGSLKNYSALSQPWLRLTESSIAPFTAVLALMPPTVLATSYSGSVNLDGSMRTSPSAVGTVELLAAGSVNGMQNNGVKSIGLAYKATTNPYVWSPAVINLSDANPASVPSIMTPLASSSDYTLATVLDNINALFKESGSTQGIYALSQTQLTLHDTNLLHANDNQPVRIYAENGSISGLTLYAGKASEVVAGQDITDIGLYIQNDNANNVSLVSAGRDLTAYDPNSSLRLAAQAVGNQIAAIAGKPNSGDIQISGPGMLHIFAGRNLDLGAGSTAADGTAVGVSSIGNARNPALPSTGADIVIGSGFGSNFSGELNVTAFINAFLNPTTALSLPTETATNQANLYLPILGKLLGLSGGDLQPANVWNVFNTLPTAEKERLALDIYYSVLRDAGRNHSTPPDSSTAALADYYRNYTAGYEAINSLFPSASLNGNMALSSKAIRSTSGGAIDVLVPGGGLSLGFVVPSGNTASSPPGIVTERGGPISIFTQSNVSIGALRIFTLRGGDIVIWSTTGNIAAGFSSKTVQSAPPTRVLIDPQSGDVKTDLAGLATGGGIGVLATVAGVAPGNVDLIAPVGTIDAGDAGIRSSGNLNIAALQVLNASNIQSSGTSTGTPAAPAAAVSAPPPTPASESGSSASDLAKASRDQARGTNGENDMPSLISVEVLGYGGGDSSVPAPDQNNGEGDKKDDKKKDKKKGAVETAPAQLTRQDSPATIPPSV